MPSENFVYCDGINSKILCPNFAAINLGGPNLTVEFWCTQTPRNYSQWLIHKQGATGGFGIYVEASGRLSIVRANPSPEYINPGTGSPVDGNWHHIALTTSASQIRLYVDGNVLHESNASRGTVFSGSGELMGVMNSNDGLNKVRGFISELRMWNVTKTQAQVQAGMAVRATGSETGLIACWHLNEGSGTASTDIKGGTSLALTDVYWMTGAVPGTPSAGGSGTGVSPITQGDLNNFGASWLNLSDSAPKATVMNHNKDMLDTVVNHILTNRDILGTLDTLRTNYLDNKYAEVHGDFQKLFGDNTPAPDATDGWLISIYNALQSARTAILARVDSKQAEGITATGAVTVAVEAAIIEATGEVLTAIEAIEPGGGATDLSDVYLAIAQAVTDIGTAITTAGTDNVTAINLYTGGQVADVLLALGAARLAVMTAIGTSEVDLHTRLTDMQTHLDTELDNAAIALDEAINTHGDGAVLAVNTARGVITTAITDAASGTQSLVDDRSDQIDTALATNQTAALAKIDTSEANTQANIVAARNHVEAHTATQAEAVIAQVNQHTDGATLGVMGAIAAATAIITSIETAVTTAAVATASLLDRISDVFSIVEDALGIINQIKELLESPTTVAPVLELVGQTTFTAMIDWDVAGDVYEIDIEAAPGQRSRVDLGDEYYIPRAAWCAYKIGGRYVRGVPLEFTKQVVTPGNPLITGVLVFPRAGTTGAIRAYKYAAP